ncbi:MAG: Fe(3+) ABC transporter substrate-binding protein [Alphaproteobacteria bacterium]
MKFSILKRQANAQDATDHRLYRFLLGSLVVGLMIGAIMQPQANAQEVNLYSARKEVLILPLLERFTQQTGIEVNIVTGKADNLMKRLQLEGINSPADLLLTVDAGRLYRAVDAGLTQPIISDKIEQRLPAAYRDQDMHWVGLSMRARPIFYNREKILPGALSTYQALTDKKWHKRVCIRSSGNIYNQSLVASMVAHDGVEPARTWAAGLVDNFARRPQGGDTDQLMAVAAGECDVAIANSYYFAVMMNGADKMKREAAQKIGLFWPNQSGDGVDGRGVHVNISGAVIAKSAKNYDSAVALIEYLLSDEAQRWYADTNGEYPVVETIEPSPLLKSWGSFKADLVGFSKLGELNPEAVKLMDRTGWK